MNLTSQQHENIARGIRRIKSACGIAKNIQIVDARFWNAPIKGTYFSTHFKKTT